MDQLTKISILHALTCSGIMWPGDSMRADNGSATENEVHPDTVTLVLKGRTCHRMVDTTLYHQGYASRGVEKVLQNLTELLLLQSSLTRLGCI